jgi:aminoglycoside N3'-acetyltransferase
MSNAKALRDILGRLEIQSGELIFLHASFKHISYLGLSPQEILSILLDVLGPRGTLAMPSFAWNMDRTARPWKGYADYYEQSPAFDIVKTPSSMGVITEVFRNMAGVKRGLSYWWPVCALGPMAELLTAGQAGITYPYGAGSSFDLLRREGAKLLGLGVTLNTSSLAPIADYQLGPDHHPLVFPSQPHIGKVIDEYGNCSEARTFTLLPDAVKTMKPEKTIAASPTLQSLVKRADVGETIQFSYPFEPYLQEALRMGKEAMSMGKPVPWLPTVAQPLELCP